MTAMHTPGPWACNASDLANPMIRHIPVLSDHGQVAIASGRANREWTNANAILIAAAPDLLEALNNILVGMEASGGWAGDDGLFDAGMAAYKKATAP